MNRSVTLNVTNINISAYFCDVTKFRLREQAWTRWYKRRGYVYHRRSAFGRVCLVWRSYLSADLPRVALLALALLPTHDTIITSHPVFTSHFVIFSRDDGIVYFLIWVPCCVPIPYNSVVLTKTGKLFQHWRIHVWPQLSNHTNITWEDIRSDHDIRARDAGANGVATKLFIAVQFSDADIGV